jgi:hypothetical protein
MEKKPKVLFHRTRRTIGVLFRLTGPVCIEFWILWCYYVWMGEVALPLIKTHTMAGLIELLLGNYFAVVLSTSLYKAYKTDPLSYNDIIPNEEHLNELLIDSEGPNNAYDFAPCHRCSTPKPPRCHHCQQCDKCVLRMDHHCIWLGNCVGLHNYKYFMLVLIYGALTTLFIVVVCFNMIYNKEASARVDIMFWVCGAISFSLTMFSVLHLYFISKNSTTLEFMAKLTDYRGKISLEYNRGKLSNFKEVFGSDLLSAVLPVIDSRQYRTHLELMHDAYQKERTAYADNRSVNNV